VPDHSTLKADGQDLSFIRVEAVDRNGNVQPNAGQEVTFSLKGPGIIAGLGSANLKSEEPYQGTSCKLFHGRALIVVRTQKMEGQIDLTASAEGLGTSSVSLKTH